MNSVQCTVYSVQCTVYSVQCTVYSVHSTKLLLTATGVKVNNLMCSDTDVVCCGGLGVI